MNEELKYHKLLQPLYKKAMGLWQEFDGYYSLEDSEYGVVTKGALKLFARYPENANENAKNLLRIPLTIDDRNPERGCWWMLDWDKFYMVVSGPKVSIIRRASIDNMRWGTGWATPTLAILKALCVQEGVEP